MIQRFFAWWKKQGCIAKLVVGFLLLVFLGCICGLPLAVLSPKTTPTPQEVAQESLAPTLTKHTPVPDTPTAKSTVLTELTPVPTATPTTEFELTLPQELRNNEGWAFTINRIELLDSIDAASRRYKPERGIFVVMIGTVSNFTDKNGCIHGQDFTLRNGSEIYEMSSNIVGAAQDIYKLDYPGFILGQCLDYDETKDSYLVFDVPRHASDLWLRLNDTEIQIGQMASLMQATPVAVVTSAPTNTPLPATATPETIVHIVQAGETLSIIADKYGITVETLMALNDIEDANKIQVGQELIVSVSAGWTPPPSSTPKPGPPTVTSTPESSLGKWFYSGKAAVVAVEMDRRGELGIWKPSAGYVFVSVGVGYANRGDSGTVHCNPFNFKIMTSEGLIFDPSMATLQPDLKAVDLAPGAKTQGWVTFEVPADATDLTLLWEPSLLSETVYIPLK